MVVLQNECYSCLVLVVREPLQKGLVLKILVNLFVEVFLSIFGKSASLVVILGCSGV